METVTTTSQETQVKSEKNVYCVVCKSDRNVVEFKGKNICKPCIAEAISM